MSKTQRYARKMDRFADRDSFAVYGLFFLVLLSGLLSGIFFWQNAGSAFKGIHPALAGTLAVVIGLFGSEGMIGVWSSILTRKEDITTRQQKIMWGGLIVATITSIFSTFAYFASSVDGTPDSVATRSGVLIFYALLLPLALQIPIIVYYTISERVTVENIANAKLKALRFESDIEDEKALAYAEKEGREAELEKRIDAYGKEVGMEQATTLMEEGKSKVFNAPRHNGANQENFPQRR